MQSAQDVRYEFGGYSDAVLTFLPDRPTLALSRPGRALQDTASMQPLSLPPHLQRPMRLAPTAVVLAAVFTFVGCDVIYERPELNAAVDFGEPYSTRDEAGTSAPSETRSAPYVTVDDQLVVDVSYSSDCRSSSFVLQLSVRDQETIDLWLLHSATEGSCSTENLVSRRLVIDLPANTTRFRRQILLTPDRGSIVLERDLG